MADVIAQVPALLPLSFGLTPNSTNHVCHFFLESLNVIAANLLTHERLWGLKSLE
jgi:hypothetical protein